MRPASGGGSESDGAGGAAKREIPEPVASAPRQLDNSLGVPQTSGSDGLPGGDRKRPRVDDQAAQVITSAGTMTMAGAATEALARVGVPGAAAVPSAVSSGAADSSGATEAAKKTFNVPERVREVCKEYGNLLTPEICAAIERLLDLSATGGGGQSAEPAAKIKVGQLCRCVNSFSAISAPPPPSFFTHTFSINMFFSHHSFNQIY